LDSLEGESEEADEEVSGSDEDSQSDDDGDDDETGSHGKRKRGSDEKEAKVSEKKHVTKSNAVGTNIMSRIGGFGDSFEVEKLEARNEGTFFLL